MDFDTDDPQKGVFALSLVSEPATESHWVSLKKDSEIKLKAIDKKEQCLLGVALIPNKPIYRNDENGEYLIEFSSDSVKNIAYEFLRRGKQNQTSLEHQVKLNEQTVNVVESWIIEDDVHDKTRKYGIKEPVGSWAVKMKVNDPKLYELAEQGELKGISIEGFFDKKLINLNTDMSKQSIVEAIKEGFATLLNSQETKTEVKLGSVTLKDGETVVQFEGEELTSGISATVNGEPIPVGRHETDSVVIVVEEAGVIASVEEMEAEATEEVDAEKEQIKSAIIEAITQLSKDFERKFNVLETKLSEATKTIEAQKEQITKLSNVEQPSAKERVNFDTNIKLNKQGRLLQSIRN